MDQVSQARVSGGVGFDVKIDTFALCIENPVRLAKGSFKTL